MTQTIAQDPGWWPHRYDPVRDEVHFIQVSRDDHRSAVFLTDEYLQSSKNPRAVKRGVAADDMKKAPLRFIFHSGYCCSTLLARAFDIPGTSMGFKEPVILNDLVGWRTRCESDQEVEPVITDILAILARPFEHGETIIVKPSCLVNVIAQDIMKSRPDATALLLYAPLKDFLGSIARKGLWGRLWVRELMSKQLRDDMIHLGLEGDDYLRLTDLQAAAVSWLAQQSLFSAMAKRLPKHRIMALDSTVLLANPADSLKSLSDHFQLELTQETIADIVAGPVFNQHSKTNVRFDKTSRESERTSGQELHADEIEKVFAWAQIVADNAGVPLTLP